MIARGSHSFTCHPLTNHTCLYSPAAGHHRPLAGTHCAYPQRDGQAKLTWVTGGRIIHYLFITCFIMELIDKWYCVPTVLCQLRLWRNPGATSPLSGRGNWNTFDDMFFDRQTSPPSTLCCYFTVSAYVTQQLAFEQLNERSANPLKGRHVNWLHFAIQV